MTTPLPADPASSENDRVLLAALVDDPDGLSDEQMVRASHQLLTSAADRTWLREQRCMDELLARELDPARADFPNRLRHARLRASSSQFVRRVTRAVARPQRRPVRMRMRLPLAAAAALAAGALLIAGWVLAQTPAPAAATVIIGEVHDADGATVHELPNDTPCTVRGPHAAVITLGTSGHAELAPSSEVELSARDQGCRLVSGSGEFAFDDSARLDAGGTHVDGAGADVRAAWVPSERHGAAPGDRALRLAVAAGEAHVRLPQQKTPQVLHPHEVLVVEMDRKSGTAVRTRRSLIGHVWAIAHQSQGLAIAVGDVHSQRTCLVTAATTVTIDERPGVLARSGSAEELQRGDAVEVSIGATDRSATPLAMAVRVDRPAR